MRKNSPADQAIRVDEVAEEMEHSLGVDPSEIIKVSAKSGLGVSDLLQAICARVRPPQGAPDGALQAMVFDSHYDEFRGAITYVRIMNGCVTRGQRIRFLRGGTTIHYLEERMAKRKQG